MNITRFKDFGNRVFESNTLYTEINLAEWKDCLMDNMEDFTSYEKNKLMMINNQPIPDIIFKLRPHLNRHIDKSKQYYFTVDIDKYGYNLFFRDERLPKSTEDFIGYNSAPHWHTRFFQVLKMSDGWFLVDFYMRDYHILYKCDQFDGLMKLLKYYSFY